MRRWVILVIELVVAVILMGASLGFFAFPYNLVFSMGIALFSGLVMAWGMPGHFADRYIEFIYGLNSRGLGPNYDFERVDRQYQTLWFAILTVWYLVLFGALLGLAAGGQYWREHGSLQGLSSAAILAFWACAALWAHFLFGHFLPRLKATLEARWHRREMEEIDQRAALYEAEHEARKEARARATATERRDPFYREPDGG